MWVHEQREPVRRNLFPVSLCKREGFYWHLQHQHDLRLCCATLNLSVFQASDSVCLIRVLFVRALNTAGVQTQDDRGSVHHCATPFSLGGASMSALSFVKVMYVWVNFKSSQISGTQLEDSLGAHNVNRHVLISLFLITCLCNETSSLMRMRRLGQVWDVNLLPSCWEVMVLNTN